MIFFPQFKKIKSIRFLENFENVKNITIELMFAGINMFLARLRLILARAQRGLK